jgi:hypothetical protein
MNASYDSCRGSIFIRNYFEVNSKHPAAEFSEIYAGKNLDMLQIKDRFEFGNIMIVST